MLVMRGVEEKRRNELTLPARLGRQGKSAAFGRAHVVGGVEVLRGSENDQAIAPFQIFKEVNAARAVSLLKFAVRPL
jgi:hypothetical protein